MKYNSSFKRIIILGLNLLGLLFETAVYAYLWFNKFYPSINNSNRGLKFYSNGHILILAIFLVLLYFFTSTYGGLKIGYLKAMDVIISQTVATLIVDIITFIQLSLMNNWLLPVGDFGIMFLPFEGLYAEAVNMGMVEELQREYKVTIAGPTTMAALLNSLQMGFNTLAIEKKSSEVWKVLSEVKKEFETFEVGLKNARNRLRMADEELEKLEGTRTRAINRKLRDVMILDDEPDAIKQATSKFIE